jgi:hypothetical protein
MAEKSTIYRVSIQLADGEFLGAWWLARGATCTGH